MNLAVIKIVDRASRQDLHARLRESGRFSRVLSHQAKNFSIHPDQTGQRMFAMRPMTSGIIGEAIRFGPDAQERIEGDQRHRRWADQVV